MNTYNINNPNFINSNIYKDFISKNPKTGYLKIRAYLANEAISIAGLNVVVSTIFNNDKIILFEGKTNESGIINDIPLPAPEINPNNLDVPYYTTYTIEATFPNSNIEKTYKVNIYDNIHVVQNITASPKMNFQGEIKWQ